MASLPTPTATTAIGAKRPRDDEDAATNCDQLPPAPASRANNNAASAGGGGGDLLTTLHHIVHTQLGPLATKGLLPHPEASESSSSAPAVVERTPTAASVSTVVPVINNLGRLLVKGRIEIIITNNENQTTTTTNAFDIVEAEAYVLAPKHNDTFTHADPQQGLFGTFYFHRMGPGKSYKGGSFKGMDVTLGPLTPSTMMKVTAAGGGENEGAALSGAPPTSALKEASTVLQQHKAKTRHNTDAAHKASASSPAVDPSSADAPELLEWGMEAPFYAGYLIRSLRNATTGEVIEGPSLVVDALLAAAGKARKELSGGSAAAPSITEWVEQTGRPHLNCAGNILPQSAASTSLPLASVGMRLVWNPNTTLLGAGESNEPKDDNTTILTAPRVGLIPRTNADLRYAGALYRYINSRPTASTNGGGIVGGEQQHPPVASSAGKKKTPAGAAQLSSSPTTVQLAKVRAGIVAALVLKRLLFLSASSTGSGSGSSSSFLRSVLHCNNHVDDATTTKNSLITTPNRDDFVAHCRAVTGATNASVVATLMIMEGLLLESSSSSSTSPPSPLLVSSYLPTLGRRITMGSDQSVGAPLPTSAKADPIKAVLGQDVKKAEVIAAVTALYGAYLLGLV